MYYLHERPLNSGVPEIARQIRLKEHETDVLIVLSEFFQQTNDGWVHPRADREIADFKGKIEQASKAGKASAERRLNGRSTVVQQTLNQTRNKKQETRNTKQVNTAPEGATPFDEFWRTWPSNKRKGAKDKCLRVWTSKEFDLQSAEILAHVRIMSKSSDWTKENGEFIPAPLTYLNESRWSGSDAVSAEKRMNQPEIDPVLEKMKQDEENATPIPENIRAKFGELIDSTKVKH